VAEAAATEIPFIGRESLVDQLWAVIRSINNVIIDAARRVGKTTMMKQMASSPPRDVVAFWIDLEDIDSADDFFTVVYSRCKSHLTLLKRSLVRGKSLIQYLSECEIWGIKLPKVEAVSWKTLLHQVITDLVMAQPKHVVFFLDEIPLMLHKITKKHNASDAGTVLDLLRRLAIEHDRHLTFVYAGSLGLHHIRKLIRRETGLNPPDVNIGKYFQVPPLDISSATHLAEILLDKTSRKYSSSIPGRIAAVTDGIPFYINSLVLDMTGNPDEWNDRMLDDLVAQQLSSPNDLWHIGTDHFTRIKNDDYYAPQIRKAAHAILDLLSSDGTSLIGSKIVDEIASNAEYGLDRGAVEELLGAMHTDHLLIKDAKNVYSFKYQIVRKYWRSQRLSL
jgi:AAA+ ATPase superfamily predicted ATPase